MTNLMETFEKNQIDKLTIKKRIPTFRTGDTLKVTIKITEGDKSRSQSFEGVCIARKNNSINSNFTVRKISHGEGVERVFPLFSTIIEKIEVVRKGDVKRAKLYFLRERTGKNARIADKDRGYEADQFELVEEKPSENSEVTGTQEEESAKDNEAKPAEVKEEKLAEEANNAKSQEDEEKSSQVADTDAEKKSDEKQS